MIGDAQELPRDGASWRIARFISRGTSVILVLATLMDLRWGETSLSPYLLGLGLIVSAAGAVGERRFREIRNEVLIVCYFGALYLLIAFGPDVVDEEVRGIPIPYIAAALVAIPAAMITVTEVVSELRKSLRDSVLGFGVLAFLGILALQDANWHEEIFWHVRQDEAVQFYLALIIAFATCIAFREAGNHRILIAMSLGVSVSGLLLPWYLADLGPLFDGFKIDLDFLRRPDEGAATLMAIAGIAGGLTALLVTHRFAPLTTAAAGALIAAHCLTEMDRFEGFADATLLPGFYVTLAGATTAVVLSLWLALRTLNPPPDPNVIPRMKEQFPRL